MKFYSGFSLKNESHFFDALMKHSEYTACGFSCGAIKAFHYVKEQLECAVSNSEGVPLGYGKRVDTLQLFSPAFFQTKSEEFKRLQLMAYRRNKEVYLRQFINSCFIPHTKRVVEHSVTILDELAELLSYEWSLQQLQDMVDKGVKIEVYLGNEDKIIDVEAAREFFKQVATVTYIKNANHFLQIN